MQLLQKSLQVITVTELKQISPCHFPRIMAMFCIDEIRHDIRHAQQAQDMRIAEIVQTRRVQLDKTFSFSFELMHLFTQYQAREEKQTIRSILQKVNVNCLYLTELKRFLGWSNIEIVRMLIITHVST